jgi:hypothetical protein
MSLLATALLATSHAVVPACAWDRPGHNRFTGDVAAAVQHYADIPAPVAARLQARIRARDFDDMAEIRRDQIQGKHQYAPELRDMHFGKGSICQTTSRSKWSDSATERGMVYCEGEHCLIVPTVCGNLSRVTRLAGPAIAGAGTAPVTDEPLASSARSAAQAQPADTSPDGSAPDVGGTPTASAGANNSAPGFDGPSFGDLAGSDGGPTPGLGLPETTGPVATASTPNPLPNGAPGWGGVSPIGPGWDRYDPVDIDRDPFLPVALSVPSIPAIPEPGTGLLALLGLVGIYARLRRR